MADTVIYQSGTSDSLGVSWDVMHVIYKREGITINSFVTARNGLGTIMRKTDLVLERWEIIKDEETLHAFQGCFDSRDNLKAEKAASAATRVEYSRGTA